MGAAHADGRHGRGDAVGFGVALADQAREGTETALQQPGEIVFPAPFRVAVVPLEQQPGLGMQCDQGAIGEPYLGAGLRPRDEHIAFEHGGAAPKRMHAIRALGVEIPPGQQHHAGLFLRHRMPAGQQHTEHQNQDKSATPHRAILPAVTASRTSIPD